MSDDSTPRLNLPYLTASQAQKHVTLNEGLGLLDGLVACAVESRTLSAQPPSPPDGALYILPPGATGNDWSLASEGALVRFEAGAWSELTRAAGQLAFVRDASVLLLFDGAGWVGAAEALGSRAKLNKAAPPGTASLLFQTGFSGRAEIGLVGDDRLSVKISADGATFVEALKVEPGGQVRLPQKPIAVAFRTAGAVTIGSTTTALVCNTEVLNAGGAYNPSTGAFICPAGGCYRVAANVLLHEANAAGLYLVVNLLKNGAVHGVSLGLAEHVATGVIQTLTVETAVACTAGDSLQIGLTAVGGDAIVFGDNYTRVSFEHLG